MATTKRKPGKRRKPGGSRLFAASGRIDRDDPRGRYKITYQMPNPCVRPDTPWLRASTATAVQRVTGKRAMESTRATLRASGMVNIRVTRTNWFS